MTREEAIEILRDTPIDLRSTREDDIHTLYATAQMMAIDALRQVEELEAEIDVLNWTIEKLSKKRPKGRWEHIHDDRNDYRCTNCEAEFVVIAGTPFQNDMPFCSHCGAEMER